MKTLLCRTSLMLAITDGNFVTVKGPAAPLVTAAEIVALSKGQHPNWCDEDSDDGRKLCLSELWFSEYLKPASVADIRCSELTGEASMIRKHPKTGALYRFQTIAQMVQLTGGDRTEVQKRAERWAKAHKVAAAAAEHAPMNAQGTVDLARDLLHKALSEVAEDDVRDRAWEPRVFMVVNEQAMRTYRDKPPVPFVDSPNTNARLVALMQAHGLKRGDVARLLGLRPRKGGSHGTVDMWLAGKRVMPALKLDALEKALRQRAPGTSD